MRILITGAHGFIGRNLIHALSQQKNAQILAIDLDLGFDLSKPGWTQQLPDEEVHTVLYLAQSLHYRQFPEGASDMFAVNTTAALELAEWARKHTVLRFIYASTGNVYKAGKAIFTEDDDCQPRGMYAATKFSTEILLRSYSSLFEVIILRPFGVYGPGQDKMLVHDMIEKVAAGEEIRLAQGVGLYLTPLFIHDGIKIITALIYRPVSQPWQVYNLAGDQVLTLGEIVQKIAAGLRVVPVIKITDQSPDYLCGDISRLRPLLSEFTPIDRGLELTLAARQL